MLETLNYRVDLMQEDVVERFSPTVSPNSAVRSPLSDSDAVLFASQDLLEDFEVITVCAFFVFF